MQEFIVVTSMQIFFPIHPVRKSFFDELVTILILIHVWICNLLLLFQLVSQVWLLVNPCSAARQASLSSTISQSLLKFMFIKSVMLSNHLILCRPLLILFDAGKDWRQKRFLISYLLSLIGKRSLDQVSNYHRFLSSEGFMRYLFSLI